MASKMKQINKIYSLLPTYLRNKWVISFLGLIFILLFIENNSLISLYKTKVKISNLKQDWEIKSNRVKTTEEKITLILENPERYARETFWMKKSNEELFIIQNFEKK